jgi:hypothetical protein
MFKGSHFLKHGIDHFQEPKPEVLGFQKISKTQNKGLLTKSKNHPALISTNVCVSMAPSPQWLLGRFFDLLTIVFRKSKNQSHITIILNK